MTSAVMMLSASGAADQRAAAGPITHDVRPAGQQAVEVCVAEQQHAPAG